MRARSISRHIPEQLELLRPFDDPIEFVVLYIAVYERQLGVSTKIIAGSLPHYAAFHTALVDHILHLALSEPLASRSLDGLTAVLASFRAREFYDREFYLACAAVLTKGTNVLLDRAQCEVLAFDYANVYILYRFSLSCVDLSSHLVSRFVSLLGPLQRSPGADESKDTENSVRKETLLLSLQAVWDDVQQINSAVAGIRPSEVLVAAYGDAVGSDDACGLYDGGVADTIVKTKLSGHLVGVQRVAFYRFETVARSAAEAYKSLQRGLPDEEAYNNIMLFCDAVSSFNDTEQLVEELQGHAKRLLVQESTGAAA